MPYGLDESPFFPHLASNVSLLSLLLPPPPRNLFLVCGPWNIYTALCGLEINFLRGVLGVCGFFFFLRRICLLHTCFLFHASRFVPTSGLHTCGGAVFWGFFGIYICIYLLCSETFFICLGFLSGGWRGACAWVCWGGVLVCERKRERERERERQGDGSGRHPLLHHAPRILTSAYGTKMFFFCSFSFSLFGLEMNGS